MKRFIFDETTRRCIGSIEGAIDGYNGEGVLVETDVVLPDILTDDMGSLYLLEDGVTIVRDITLQLTEAKSGRKATVKAEAARLISASDWKLARAREREAAGWGDLAAVDAVLAEREAVRRSSDAAEAAIDALTDVASVRGFTWSVDVAVPVPRRLTPKAFSDRFTEAEMQALLAAAGSNVALMTWWEKFKLAQDINLDDPATQSGVQALEIAGLLSAGRAAEVLA